MSPFRAPFKSNSAEWSIPPQTRSNVRLAMVAGTVLITIFVLAMAAIEARRAERALAVAAAHTLRDYAGYAGRTMGGEVLRRFSEQRGMILSPVSGSANRDVPEPALEDIVARGQKYFETHHTPTSDLQLGYFRVDLRTKAVQSRGVMGPALAARIADTLTTLLAHQPQLSEPSVVVIEDSGVPRSIAYASLVGRNGQPIAAYGYAYARAAGIAATAGRAFHETPLLPISFAGTRWNYDTTAVRAGEIVNDSLLGVRITDRAGHVFWQSDRVDATAGTPYTETVILSTLVGGIIVQVALRPSSEPSLIPSAVRRSQRTSLQALFALTVLLSIVSLLALRRERLGAQSRRAEAMQQLALGLRHELNNALASVMLNAELLVEEDKLDAEQSARLVAIVEQADRMRSVLRRLEKAELLDVVVPYMNEGYMVDLSATSGEKPSSGHPV